MDDGALRVRVAPDEVLARMEAALARPAKRLFGIKVADHFIGLTDREGRRFEVWERRGHAVHLLGRVSGERGGARIGLETAVTLRARIFLVLFAVMYAVALYGLTAVPGAVPALSALGLLVVAVVFLFAVRAQRAALRRFVRGVFADVLRD